MFRPEIDMQRSTVLLVVGACVASHSPLPKASWDVSPYFLEPRTAFSEPSGLSREGGEVWQCDVIPWTDLYLMPSGSAIATVPLQTLAFILIHRLSPWTQIHRVSELKLDTWSLSGSTNKGFLLGSW